MKLPPIPVYIALVLSLVARTTRASLSTLVAHENGIQTSLRAGSTRRAQESCKSIRRVICSLGNTKKFCELVTAALEDSNDYDIDIDGPSIYTVFAPTDEAFAKIEEPLSQLTPEELRRTLYFHFYPDIAMTYMGFECSEKLVSVTGDGSRTKCRRKEPGVYAKHQRGDGNLDLNQFPRIDDKTKEACSGLIHRLNHVMLPIVYKPFKPFLPPPTEKPTEKPVDKKPPPINETPVGEINIDADDSEAPTGVPSAAPTAAPTVKTTAIWTDLPTTSYPTYQQSTESPVESPPKTTTEKPTKAKEDGLKNPPDSIASQDNVQESEQPPKKPRIGALGINLILFSTLLLCFVFVCMRR